MQDDSLQKLIGDTFRETIRNGPYPEELKKFLLTHERKAKFYNNLVREFSNPRIKRTSRDAVIKAVRDLTHIFVLAAKRRADELNMSAIERGMLKDQESKKAEMRKLSNAMDNAEKTNVTQDKAGNETSQSETLIDERFV